LICNAYFVLFRNLIFIASFYSDTKICIIKKVFFYIMFLLAFRSKASAKVKACFENARGYQKKYHQQK
ncbi:hypothetical protein, partial [Flammeovirga sp. EKP202]|uniref:hypothetical protein n=1 Tax=Flammeovirga sp. EKP202 TaxID=2770592 RepID=UPI001CB7DB51